MEKIGYHAINKGLVLLWWSVRLLIKFLTISGMFFLTICDNRPKKNLEFCHGFRAYPKNQKSQSCRLK